MWHGLCESRGRKWRIIRSISEVSADDKEGVRCRPDARADGTICQTHLSPGSPAAISFIVITAAWWMDLCGVWWYVSSLSQHHGNCAMWRARRGTECFQPVLPLDNCAYVDGSAQHTYASGQHRLSFPRAFVPSVPHDGEVWLFIQFSAISSLVLSYFFLPFPSFSVSCPVLSFPLLFPFQFPFSFPFLFPFLS